MESLSSQESPFPGRRSFLRFSSLALAALALPRSLRAQSCVLTSSDAFGLGPFYVENAPVRTTQLAAETEPGEKLRITGTVRDCSGPLAGAKVEVWHADDSGCYSNFPEGQLCEEYPAAGSLRGVFITDSQGRYGYSTIMPGAYTDGGGKYRTPHIHYQVSFSSSANTSAQLVTQLYFQGAPYLDTDDGVGDAMTTSGNQRIIPLSPASGGGREGIFDIVVQESVTSLHQGRVNPRALVGFDVMMRREGRTFRLVLPPHRLRGEVRLRVSNPLGRILLESRHTEREIVWDGSRLSAGVYRVELLGADGSQESFPCRLV